GVPSVSTVNVAQKQHDVNFLLFKVYI
nr:RecName: Full=Hemocyanin subunit 3 [Homarus americanus]